MGYTKNLEKAARRHLRAGQVLYDQDGPGDQPGCIAVAGYLFGIAGELAVKEIMRNSGMKPLAEDQRRDDPFFLHFPVLKTMLARSAQGRRAGELLRFSENPGLFQNWEIAMRYAPTSDISETWVEAWRKSAEELIKRMVAE